MSDYVVNVQESKKAAVGALVEEFKDVKDFIFTDYRGLSVEQITNLRNELRKNNAVYKVIKNRFAKIALKDLGHSDVGLNLVGPTAIALAKDEAGPVAKILVDFAKNNPMDVKGGLIAGNVYDTDEVEAFSKLPTRMELIAKLMRTMNAPLQNLVYVMDAVPTKLVRTLKAVADKKAEEQ